MTEFPFTNPASILFGIAKAYPALNKYMKENKIDDTTYAMEIYDIPGKKIIYLFR